MDVVRVAGSLLFLLKILFVLLRIGGIGGVLVLVHFFGEHCDLGIGHAIPDDDDAVVDGAIDEDRSGLGAEEARDEVFSPVLGADGFEANRGSLIELEDESIAAAILGIEWVEPHDLAVGEFGIDFKISFDVGSREGVREGELWGFVGGRFQVERHHRALFFLFTHGVGYRADGKTAQESEGKNEAKGHDGVG